MSGKRNARRAVCSARPACHPEDRRNEGSIAASSAQCAASGPHVSSWRPKADRIHKAENSKHWAVSEVRSKAYVSS